MFRLWQDSSAGDACIGAIRGMLYAFKRCQAIHIFTKIDGLTTQEPNNAQPDSQPRQNALSDCLAIFR